MLKLFKINKFRYLLSLASALLVAIIANHYYASTSVFLIPLTALYVMQTPIGNSFYQGIRHFSLVLILVAIASLLVSSMPFFYLVMHDVVIGASIGIIANLIILPRRADTEFREAVLPLVRECSDYFTMTANYLLQKDVKDPGNAKLENRLLKLPLWVYERGFDSGLQVGYRFFLTRLTLISDVLFAMHHLARHEYDKELLAKIRLPMLQCMDYISQFFAAVVTVLELKELEEKVNDLEKEIDELEKQFHHVVPLSLDLLDMKRDYVYLAEFIYHLKDLRKLLLKLAEALR